MESPQEQQPEHLRQLHHGRNNHHHRPHSNYHHHRHQKDQFQQENNNYEEKKNTSSQKRYNHKNRNRIRNRSRNSNDMSDASVSTASSNEGFTTNNRDMFRRQGENNINLTKSSTNKNGRSRKDNKKPQNRNRFSPHKNSEEDSMALNSYLRECGWSLSDDLIRNNNHGPLPTAPNATITTTIDTTTCTSNSGTGTAAVLRESELLRKRALKLLETTLCRWAASIEKNPIAWQRVRGTYNTYSCILYIHFQTKQAQAHRCIRILTENLYMSNTSRYTPPLFRLYFNALQSFRTVTLVTFGSYRLRAYRPDADVDLLALCPPSCTRKDFFTSLVEMMEGEAAISHIHPIASAFTPVIKFTIHNIHFDMLFGRASGKANIEKLVHFQRLSLCPLGLTNMNIARETGVLGIATHAEAARGQRALVNNNNNNNNTATTDNQIEGTAAGMLHEFTIEDSFLTGMEDDSEVRSANGVRVTQFIINYVPNADRFRLVLCAVKEWAMLHGIYSNVLGFLGGVNWAIMVAYVCKRYPNQLPSTLLSSFFKVFATWNWPKPVLLGSADGTTTGTTAGGMKPWDPKTNPRDARHVMPIITPVFPRSKIRIPSFFVFAN